ncbi:MAG: 16S rRNA (cytosine(1402)-N(4))-methyltransferase RsmH [Williamsia sp.]|nr:16S rRNA (cytosine(1402)-N(4))-methyltransferase RsmH [Williamsia sp.]
MEEKDSYHEPVLLQEVIDALAIRANGLYVDCTFGGGGHAKRILSLLGSEGRLVAFDQDADALQNMQPDPRLLFLPHNFRHLERFLRLHKTGPVDGVLADLGVSSHQLDKADRGFSTRFEADLDMRMDRRQTLTAYDVIQTYPEEKLHKLFEQYGEVTNAKTLAHTIVAVRRKTSLQSVNNFKTALYKVVKGNPHKYFAQVFQALRIEVNDELGALREMLQQLPAVLKPGARAAIITFHSLEDRIVKNFFKRGDFEPEQDSNPFGQHESKKSLLEPLYKKPVLPGKEELQRNPRSGSAKLRVAVRK